MNLTPQSNKFQKEINDESSVNLAHSSFSLYLSFSRSHISLVTLIAAKWLYRHKLAPQSFTHWSLARESQRWSSSLARACIALHSQIRSGLLQDTNDLSQTKRTRVEHSSIKRITHGRWPGLINPLTHFEGPPSIHLLFDFLIVLCSSLEISSCFSVWRKIRHDLVIV